MFKVILLAVLLTGCAAEPKVVYQYKEVTKPVYHPARPVPVKSFVPNWKVVDGSVQMTYDESVRYRVWLEQVKSYIDNQNLVLCHYRVDLNEPICKRSINK